MGQCLTSSIVETYKKKKKCGPNYGLTGQNRGQNDLLYFNVVGHTVRLACSL